MASTKPKMKGIFKGFKYISQIFDEEKDDGIQIGFPTDVKHVAHIGWDGPTIENPSWMKEFNATTGFQSAPLGPPTGGDGPKAEPEIKWVSEDSNARRINKPPESPGRDVPDLPKSTRRHHSSSTNESSSTSSPRKKDPSTRPRRRNHSKDSSEGSVRSNRQSQESSQSCDSPSRAGVPDPARRSRRKKSRELGGEGSTRSRPKPASTGADAEPAGKESVEKTNPEPPQVDPTPSTQDEE